MSLSNASNATQTVLGWWFVLTILIIGLFDGIAIIDGRSDITVSWWLRVMGERYPILYLVLGMAIGHILFPLSVPNGDH